MRRELTPAAFRFARWSSLRNTLYLVLMVLVASDRLFKLFPIQKSVCCFILLTLPFYHVPHSPHLPRGRREILWPGKSCRNERDGLDRSARNTAVRAADWASEEAADCFITVKIRHSQPHSHLVVSSDVWAVTKKRCWLLFQLLYVHWLDHSCFRARPLYPATWLSTP